MLPLVQGDEGVGVQSNGLTGGDGQITARARATSKQKGHLWPINSYWQVNQF